MIIDGNFIVFHRVGPSSTVSGSNWKLEMLVFVKGGKPEYPEKKILVGGRRVFHHIFSPVLIPSPPPPPPHLPTNYSTVPYGSLVL